MLCNLIFLVATAGIGYIGYYAVQNGDPNLILSPYDATGAYCGTTPGYENYPYLWF